MDQFQITDFELSNLKLEEIIDLSSLDILLSTFCELTGYAVGILDVEGKVLVAKNWQNVCMKFHRVNPLSCKNCSESDTVLTTNIERGKYKLYKCKNNMWDISTPIYIKEKHVGNIFFGQFFFDDEAVDYDLFSQQAEQYSFDKEAYLKALKKVPVWSHEEVNQIMTFYSKLAEIVSDLGYQNILLKKLLEERKRELEQSENKLTLLMKSMSETTVLYEMLFDSEGNPIDYLILDFNQSFIEHFKLTKKDVMGKKISELPFIKPELHLEEYQQVIEKQVNYDHMEYLPTINEYYITSVFPSGKNQFITISTDVTEIKEMQETLASKNRELENYLYVASHDLRSPLVNIQGFTQRLKKQTDEVHQLLKDNINDKSTSKKLEQIFKQNIPSTLDFIFNNVKKMDDLIKGLLVISRTGRTEMSNEHVDMNDLLKQILESINFQISDQNIGAEIDLLPSCYGDYNLLNRLFTNLIDNAIKYKDPKRPLTIKVYGKADNHFSIYTVEDNGIGIAKRHLEKIWDVFYRIDPMNSKKGEGLGLSIVKTIIDKHKGKINVKSEEGKGTIFEIKIPNQHF